MNNLQVLFLDSREVAKMLSKRHADLLRDIATYSQYLSDFNERNFALVDFFQESSYQDSKGETRKCYLITKKGCEFIAHKMTGKKGSLFTATYINRFHEMEEALQQKPTVPVPIFPKCLWQGQVVMPASYVASLTGIAGSTLLSMAKQCQYPFLLLQGKLLRQFKQENHILQNSSCRMVIYPFETVEYLLKQRNLYEKHAAFLRVYFCIENDLPHNVPCYTEELGEEIQKIKKELITLDTMLNNLIMHKRKEAEHAAYFKICTEIAVMTTQHIVNLKQFAPNYIKEMSI